MDDEKAIEIEKVAREAEDLLPAEAIEFDATQDYLSHLIEATDSLLGERADLLDRLRTAEAERDAEKDARDEVQEKIAYLRRNCMGLPEQELRQKIGAVGSAEWKRGYYWNTLVLKHNDRANAAEVAQRRAEERATAAGARAAEAEAVIAEAVKEPHADTCATELSPDAGYECSCHRAILESNRPSALARVKAEAWDEGAHRVVDWNKRWPLVMPTDNPYRKGDDHDQ